MNERSKLLMPGPRMPEKRVGNVRRLIGRLLSAVSDEAGIDVEPLPNATLSAGQRNIVQVAVENDIAPGERRSALGNEDPLSLPAAEISVCDAVHFRQELLAFAEGQFVNAADRDAMGEVLVGDDAIGHRVGAIQVVGRLHELRIGIGAGQSDAAREPFLRLGLQRVIPGVALVGGVVTEENCGYGISRLDTGTKADAS